MQTEKTATGHQLLPKFVKREFSEIPPDCEDLTPEPASKWPRQSSPELMAGLKVPDAASSSRQGSAVLKSVPQGVPPALWACRKGDVKMLSALICLGIDLEDTANGCFSPPIHMAVQRLNVKLVRLLLEKGVSLDSKDKTGDTALMMAKTVNDWYCDSEESLTILRLIESEVARRSHV